VEALRWRGITPAFETMAAKLDERLLSYARKVSASASAVGR
jgi:hypothetical protein